MAILLLDGCGHYGTADIKRKWSSSYPSDFPSGTFSISSVNSRRSSSRHVLVGSSGAWLQKAIPGGGLSALTIGLATRQSALGALELQFVDAAGVQVSVRCNPDGSFEALRAGITSLGVSVPGCVVASGWHYVEVHVEISASAGAVSVSIDGGDAALELAGVNTKGSTSGAVTAMRIKHAGLCSGSLAFTDLYIAGNDPFRGDCRVDTYFPAADGSVSEWGSSYPSAHYQAVDEQSTINCDTDYVYASQEDKRDFYDHSGAGTFSANSVHAVAVSICLRKLGETSLKVRPGLYVSGAAYYYGSSETPTADYLIRQAVWGENPHTSASWTDEEVRELEIGIMSTTG